MLGFVWFLKACVLQRKMRAFDIKMMIINTGFEAYFLLVGGFHSKK
jgi:hypothetical protein